MDICDREVCFALKNRHNQLDWLRPNSAKIGRALDDTAAGYWCTTVEV